MQSKSSPTFRAPSVQRSRSKHGWRLEFEPQHPCDKAKYGSTCLQPAGEAEKRIPGAAGLSVHTKWWGPGFETASKKQCRRTEEIVQWLSAQVTTRQPTTACNLSSSGSGALCSLRGPCTYVVQITTCRPSHHTHKNQSLKVIMWGVTEEGTWG